MTKTIQIIFDCADPGTLSAFWAEALGYVPEPVPEGYADWDAWDRDHGLEPNSGWACQDPDGKYPEVFFQRVPEPKTVKNRLHLDIYATDVEGEVQRVERLGATRVEMVDKGPGHRWMIMRDPEGNEFCVVEEE